MRVWVLVFFVLVVPLPVGCGSRAPQAPSSPLPTPPDTHRSWPESNLVIDPSALPATVEQLERTDPTSPELPHALLLLAVLRSDTVRADFESDLAVALEPSNALFLHLATDFPDAPERAAALYYLGHAYTDGARIEEGQQAWRALVCRNRYQVRPDPADPSKIELQPLEQDHDEQFWKEWDNTNPLPMDEHAIGGRRVVAVEQAPVDEELAFRDPYANCEMVPQHLEPGVEPGYVAEVWWQIGNYHFDQVDPAGGPYNLNRAVSAYQHALAGASSVIEGVATYRLAWTFFKQQRYHRSVKEFVRLLHYADKQEEETGDPGADYRSEAYTYIAGALTYVDFEGPPAHHPYIPRHDVLDLETDPLVAEQKMAVAIQRVQDPRIVPQDQKWTVEIYKALAQEFIEITQHRNAIATLELTLDKFPLDRDAPAVQNKVAELYEKLARLAPEGSAAKEEYTRRALSPLFELKNYVGNTEWTRANKDNPEALNDAAVVARNGLRRSAAIATNAGRACFNEALEIHDTGEQRHLLEKTVEQYRFAARAWETYTRYDPRALDAYESKFWLADARYWIVVLQVLLDRSPRPDEVSAARRAVAEVRDSTEGDEYLQPAAFYAVSIEDKLLEDQHRLFGESGGARGIPRLEAVGRVPIRRAIPEVVAAALRARQEFLRAVPPAKDPEDNASLYLTQIADTYLAYGHVRAAKRYLEVVLEKECRHSPLGSQAFARLWEIAAREGAIDDLLDLAQREADPGTRCELTKTERVSRLLVAAGTLFDLATRGDAGSKRDQVWRQAGESYRADLADAESFDQVTEATVNGAYAFKQVGDSPAAARIYEQATQRVAHGSVIGSKGSPEEDAKVRRTLWQVLAHSAAFEFDYVRCADWNARIASDRHFPEAVRQEAAEVSVPLFAGLDDAKGLQRAVATLASLHPTPEQLAKNDIVVARQRVQRWDASQPNTGSNAERRTAALAAMKQYYAKYRAQPAAARYLVEAAAWIAKLGSERDARTWRGRAVEAYARWMRTAPEEDRTGSMASNLAAEAEYLLIDEELTRALEQLGQYRGTVAEVLRKFRSDAILAKQYTDRLQRMADVYHSPRWSVVAFARIGSLYDTYRTAFYDPTAPDLDERTRQRIHQESRGNSALEKERIRAWKEARDREVATVDELIVRFYAVAWVGARRYGVTHPQVTLAARRLAFWSSVVDDRKLRAYLGNIEGLDYTPGMFDKLQPGMQVAPTSHDIPPPLPALPRRTGL